MSLFVDGALTSDATTVDCTLENGSETTCYQVQVASLASTVDTDGPFCPATTTSTTAGSGSGTATSPASTPSTRTSGS